MANDAAMYEFLQQDNVLSAEERYRLCQQSYMHGNTAPKLQPEAQPEFTPEIHRSRRSDISTPEISMSRKGEPHDNAVAENFFSCLKCELVYLTIYATRRQAQNSIFRYIEGFYNPVRPHSSIGWLSPMEYARQLKRQNVA